MYEESPYESRRGDAMRRGALENAADAQDAKELRRDLREQKAANRELAEVVARQSETIEVLFTALKVLYPMQAEPIAKNWAKEWTPDWQIQHSTDCQQIILNALVKAEVKP